MSPSSGADTPVLDLRTYQLLPGRRETFDYILRERALPMLCRYGIEVVGYAGYDPEAADFDRLASRVANAEPDGVYLAGLWFEGGDRVLKALRNRLGSRLPIMATDAWIPIADMFEAVDDARWSTPSSIQA